MPVASINAYVPIVFEWDWFQMSFVIKAIVTDVTNGVGEASGVLIGPHLALAHGSSYLHTAYMEDYPGARC